MNTLQNFMAVVVAVIGVTTLFLTVLPSEKLEGKPKLLFNKISLKRFLVVLNILAILISIPLQVMIVTKDSSNKIKDSEKQNRINQKLLSNFKTSIDTAKKTLGTANVMLTSLKQVQAKVDSQLYSLQHLNYQSTTLLNQNKAIAGKQIETYNHVDKLLNPLFPMSLTIFLSVPFDDKLVTGLKQFAMLLKIENNKKGINYKYIRFHNDLLINGGVIKDTVICADIEHADSVLNGMALENFWNVNNYKISFVKGKNVENVELLAKFKPYKSMDAFLMIDYYNRKFNFKIDYGEFSFSPTYRPASTVLLGFNDLLNSTFKFNLDFESSKYRLVAISLSPTSGLESSYTFLFNEKEVVKNELGNKIYSHLIKETDLSTYQPDEIFFDNK